MPKTPDDIQRMVRGEASPPIATLLGFTLTSAGSGEVFIEFEAAARHANPMGTLHGGVLCNIADAAMGLAYASTLAAGETFTTEETSMIRTNNMALVTGWNRHRRRDRLAVGRHAGRDHASWSRGLNTR